MKPGYTITTRLTPDEEEKLATLARYYGVTGTQLVRFGLAALWGMYSVETAAKPKGQHGPKRGTRRPPVEERIAS